MQNESPAVKVLRQMIKYRLAVENYWKNGGKNPRATTYNKEAAAHNRAMRLELEDALERVMRVESEVQ